MNIFYIHSAESKPPITKEQRVRLREAIKQLYMSHSVQGHVTVEPASTSQAKRFTLVPGKETDGSPKSPKGSEVGRRSIEMQSVPDLAPGAVSVVVEEDESDPDSE